MADRTYYGLLEFENGHLKKVAEKPANLPGSGVTQADLTLAERRARVWVFQKLVKVVGATYARTLDAAWVSGGATYPGAVPTDVRELAKLVGSSFVWDIVEAFHGREKQQDDRKKQSRTLVSVKLLQDAEARWKEIVAAGVLVYDDMTVTDLAAASQAYPIGVASPAGDTTFFPPYDSDLVHGVPPAYSAEGVFKSLEGDLDP